MRIDYYSLSAGTVNRGILKELRVGDVFFKDIAREHAGMKEVNREKIMTLKKDQKRS